jgi:hypothetical protein
MTINTGFAFWKTSKVDSARPVLVLGSSVSEQFDYIFGDNPDYYPFWAGGWSARGLLSEGRGTYLESIVAPVDRTANVFLVFGSVDVVFNAAFRANKHGFRDFHKMMIEARRGICRARRILHRNGFRRITAVFAAPPSNVPQSYWAKLGVEQQLPTNMLAHMYADLAADVSRRMPTINLVSRLTQSPKYPVLKDEFLRERHDHHPDYLKIGPLICESLEKVLGMLPPRFPAHSAVYRHEPHSIGKLKAQSEPRPRTCC